MNITRDITEFREAFGLPINEKPALLTIEDMALHVELIHEEFDEMKEAYLKGNLTEVFDGIVDMMYVLGGLAVHMGLPLEEGWKEVHSSNMSKLDENGEPIISDGSGEFPKGKALKSDRYFAPRLDTVLEAASRELNHADAVVREIRAMEIDEIRVEIAKRREFNANGWEFSAETESKRADEARKEGEACGHK